MPVSWEMASGPTVAYNMARQGKSCVAVEGPLGSNFSILRVQDAMSRGFSTSGETPKGSNYRLASSHDTVVRGLSTLSLCGQYQLDVDSAPDESRSGSRGAFCFVSSKSFTCTSSRNDESRPFAHAPPSGCGKPLGLGSSACDRDFLHRNEMHNQAVNVDCRSGKSLQPDAPQMMAFSPTCRMDVASGNDSGEQGLPQDLCGSYSTLKSANVQESACRTDGFDLDTISELSCSSQNGMAVTSSLSGEISQGSDDTEVQSVYKEGGDLSSAVPSISPRRGLSRFYAGKSQSFSCLRDVASVKDLAKPESPFAKKRKVNSSSSGLPPLQKGSATISKKPLQSGKSTLALAVAMSTREEKSFQFADGTPVCQKSSVPSRSYSLSDLQGAAGSLFFIG